jgi:hypothetical protein
MGRFPRRSQGRDSVGIRADCVHDRGGHRDEPGHAGASYAPGVRPSRQSTLGGPEGGLERFEPCEPDLLANVGLVPSDRRQSGHLGIRVKPRNSTVDSRSDGHLRLHRHALQFLHHNPGRHLVQRQPGHANMALSWRFSPLAPIQSPNPAALRHNASGGQRTDRPARAVRHTSGTAAGPAHRQTSRRRGAQSTAALAARSCPGSTALPMSTVASRTACDQGGTAAGASGRARAGAIKREPKQTSLA